MALSYTFRRNLLLAITYGIIALTFNFSSPLWLSAIALVNFLALRAAFPRLRQLSVLWCLLLLQWAPLFIWKTNYDFISSYGKLFGLAYFSLHATAFLIDCRRGRITKLPSFPDYLLYLIFFPRFFAGPIQRFGDFHEQLRSSPPPLARRWPEALYLLGSGAFKRFVLGLVAIEATRPYFESIPRNAPETLLASYVYFLQFYFNFSGYVDLARGTSLLCGISLPHDLHFPFLSLSPQEYWQRWHLSIRAWLKDYVYDSLFFSTKNLSFSIFATFLALGLWAGNRFEWRYIAMGAFSGGVMVIYAALRPQLRWLWHRLPAAGVPIYLALCWVVAFHLADISGFLRYAPDLRFSGKALASLGHWEWTAFATLLALRLPALIVPIYALDFILWRKAGEISRFTGRDYLLSAFVALAASITLFAAFPAAFSGLNLMYLFFRF